MVILWCFSASALAMKPRQVLQWVHSWSRTFGERFREHQKAPSPIFDHYNTTAHKISLDNFSIVGREDQNLIRTIKEALYIRVNNPSLNRNIGKYHLPYIWDEVLFNIQNSKYNKQLTHGNTICPPGNNIYQSPTLQWPFHLPLGNNILPSSVAVTCQYVA